MFFIKIIHSFLSISLWGGRVGFLNKKGLPVGKPFSKYLYLYAKKLQPTLRLETTMMAVMNFCYKHFLYFIAQV